MILVVPKITRCLGVEAGGPKKPTKKQTWKEMGLGKNGRDVMLLALQMEEEAIRQGMGAASRSWERQGNRFSLEPPSF